jgi:hypothetical protein
LTLETTSKPTFPEEGSLKGQSWLCSWAGVDLKPCHKPAHWMIECRGLRLGSCHLHKDAILESLTPGIRVWDMSWLTGMQREQL